MTALSKRMDCYVMGVPELDSQHKHLFESIAALHKAMLEKNSSEIIANLVKDFRTMLLKHFSFEEAFLKEHGMPATEEHKREHRRLIEQFESISKGTKVGLSIRLMDFFYTSLFTHIEKLDSVYVRSSGCQPTSCTQ